MKLTEIQQWGKKNLLTRQQAAKITGQSYTAFSQTIKTGKIKPFFEFGDSGPSVVRLYLKSDIEEYAQQLKTKKSIVSQSQKVEKSK
ncbi:helix-turn-helix domain-containing protein [Enterococcus mundtii]|uniref:helix-turn-helix domain-containing protein n=1 Tax=Enterococcus mundtii TaxID=53346 RepID=UPI00115AFFE5|nr:helix-turn-helix domain-containing protein [Enterococcus mundtii]MBE6173687.1 helix-turn-helix domain-containing protein [Enterococcus faecium]